LSDKIALATSIVAVPILQMTTPVGLLPVKMAGLPDPVQKIFEHLSFKATDLNTLLGFIIFLVVDAGLDLVKAVLDDIHLDKLFAKFQQHFK
jgi:hypothetical protein